MAGHSGGLNIQHTVGFFKIPYLVNFIIIIKFISCGTYHFEYLATTTNKLIITIF